MKIAIVHLDLGQGGAERQTIDEAIALKQNGHDVTILTSHHDPTRAFDETTDTNILANNIRVYGDWIPRHLFGKFHVLMSIYRMLWCTLRLLCGDSEYDIILVDQVPAVIPFLKLHRNTKVIYYCHHPDLLLVQNKHNASFLKQQYRCIMDWFETITTANCDELLVNSQYTKRVVLHTFPYLKQMSFLQPHVVYPAIDTKQFESVSANRKMNNNRITFLSINRYEQKKQIEVAIKALHKLLINVSDKNQKIKLIIAGGYDERVSENQLYLAQLMDLCSNMQLKHQLIKPEISQKMQTKPNMFLLDDEHVDKSAVVYFMIKFPDRQKAELLRECSAVLYTPKNEHFGIVPIEAMLAMRPVIASKSGGPLETIVHGETGYLCEDKEEEWANAMNQFVNDRGLTRKMGEAGKQRVIQNFSRKQLEKVMQDVVNRVKDKRVQLDATLKLQTWFIMICIVLSFVVLVPVFVPLSKLP